MSEGPSSGALVASIFLLVGGTCLVLLGGGCTLGALGDLGRPHSGELDFTNLILTISLITLAVGALMIWGGIRLLKSREDDWDR